MMSATTKVYNARGTATHDHYVQLTADDYAVLKSGGTVKKIACNGGAHEFWLSCGTSAGTPGDPMCDPNDMCASAMNMLCPDQS